MIFPPHGYAPHARHFGPAVPRSTLWRTLLGTMGIAVIYLSLMWGLIAFLRSHYGSVTGTIIYAAMARGATPGAMLLLLFSFMTMGIGAITVTRLLHGRRAGTLFGDARRARADFLRVAVPILGLHLLLLPLVLMGKDPARHLGMVEFLSYLPVALVATLVQSGSEELVFRGYLQQQLAARFRQPWVWIIAPSLLFAGMHSVPGQGEANLVVILWAFCFGLCAADLTARTGTLGAAIGFHFANNAAAFLLVGINGALNGLSLWSYSLNAGGAGPNMPVQAADFVLVLVCWLLARLSLRL